MHSSGVNWEQIGLFIVGNFVSVLVLVIGAAFKFQRAMNEVYIKFVERLARVEAAQQQQGRELGEIRRNCREGRCVYEHQS